MAKTDILRAICGKGGMILYEDLENMGLEPLQELKRIISENPDTFKEVCLGGRMFVTARSNISLCETPDCLGCKRLHMCKGYMLGSCNDTGCPFSHDLHSPHNMWVLKQFGLKGLKENEISVLLFQDEPPPQPPPNLSPKPHPHQDPPQPAPRLQMPTLSNSAANASVFQANQNSSGSDGICQMHLIHRCSVEGQCDEVHSSMPYQWQRRVGKQWRAFPNNEEIERDYCNPVKTKHDGTPPLDFDLMRCGSSEVRRLSVTSPEFHTVSLLVTTWAWYWEFAEDQWIEYASPDGKADNLNITGEKLEQKYQEGEPFVQFARGENRYILSFKDMIETHQIMKRLVRRRPVLISPAEVQKVCEKYAKRIHSNFLSSVPQHWNHSLLPGTGYERIKLETSSQDYRRIVSQFNQTMMRCDILSIERIQNLKLWRFFMLQKNQMKNDTGKNGRVERLFHGTESEYIDAVCHGNADRSFNTLTDTRFGRGCYFSKDASYANEYTNKQGVRFLFMCQVTVGDYALGQPDYYRPPFKDEKKTVSYDSCVDDLARPSVYVIFEKNQIYPEFLIKYRTEDDQTYREEPHVQVESFYETIDIQPNEQSQSQSFYEPINIQPQPVEHQTPPPKPRCCEDVYCNCEVLLDCCSQLYKIVLRLERKDA
ncbi:protein mono-ADP-ribosyltransferase PARP12-like isoform X1 [Alosa pseudoharengus]|uniref:protein mono-ADP-ribosyltransferase PARP12-like isoform X1 n=1 Tax=Alosa pseudoharengus TaxID=34774 RepID=UPI003F88F916